MGGRVIFSGDADAVTLAGKSGDSTINYFYHVHRTGPNYPGQISNEVGAFDFAVRPGDPPNFVIILVDDLGYGDLGVYGATDNQPPIANAAVAGAGGLSDRVLLEVSVP